MSDSTTSVAATMTNSFVDFVTKWVVWRFGGMALGAVVLGGSLLYLKQENLLYLPVVQGIPRHNRDNPNGYRSPADRGLEHYFNVKLPTEDGIRIHGWYLIHPQALQNQNSNKKKLPTLVFFHGNAGNIGLRLPNAWQMMQKLSCHVLLVEYRGYGDSDDAKPNEIGLKLDAQAVFQWISQETKTLTSSTTTKAAQVTPSSQALGQGASAFLDASQIYLFGRSLGGAVAFSLAGYLEQQLQQPVAGLIVENTFLSISEMVDRIFPFLTPIKPYVLRMDWNNHQVASTLIQTPVLYLAVDRDELVPHAHMQTLYQTSLLAGNPKATMHVIENGTHNESWYMGGMEYWNAIQQFIYQKSKTTTTSSSGAADLDGADATAIPIMSSNIMDMAKEAFNNKSDPVNSKKIS